MLSFFRACTLATLANLSTSYWRCLLVDCMGKQNTLGRSLIANHTGFLVCSGFYKAHRILVLQHFKCSNRRWYQRAQ
jgi:hypothetical protein